MKVEATLTVSAMRSSGAFSQLKGVWQTLERMDTACMPANTWQWAQLWWKHHSCPQDTLVLLVAKMKNEIVAIAPFYINNGRMCGVVPVRTLRFIGSGRGTTSKYLNIIAIPKHRVVAEQAILDHVDKLKDWQRLYLCNMRKDSSLMRTVRKSDLLHSGPRARERQHHSSLTELPDSWDQYLAKLSHEQRQQVRDRQDRVDAVGTVEMNLSSTSGEAREATEALLELGRRGSQSKRARDAFQNQKDEEFHRELIREFFASDQLWLATLTLDGQIIGVLYLFAWRGRLQFVKGGCSPDHSSLSPEQALSIYVVKRGIEQGMETIDWLEADYEPECANAKSDVMTSDISLIRPGFRSMLSALVGAGGEGWRHIHQHKTDLQ